MIYVTMEILYHNNLSNNEHVGPPANIAYIKRQLSLLGFGNYHVRITTNNWGEGTIQLVQYPD